jgi:U3 small nucleolar RNA-associated protein 4
MKALAVHRCRFAHFTPAAIVCISHWKDVVAVARANGHVQLYRNFVHFKTISSFPAEDVCLLGTRLFVAGLSGEIQEFDTVTSKVVDSADSMGGPIWCMRICPQKKRIAIGCEDGHVRIFDIDGLVYIMSSDKQPDRVISLCWHPSGDYIVAGSTKGKIRQIDARSGRTLKRITLESTRGSDTVIWCLACLPDATIVSGDSLGHLTFFQWDHGTLKKVIKAHFADVLCLAYSKSGKVFSSGVDARIVQTNLVTYDSTVNKKSTWVNSNQRKYHTHDVRSLLCLDERPNNCLISGGIDGGLIIAESITDFANASIKRLPLFPQRSPVSVAAGAKMVSCLFDDNIKLWKLGQVLEFDSNDSLIADQQKLEHLKYRKLLELKMKVFLINIDGK